MLFKDSNSKREQFFSEECQRDLAITATEQRDIYVSYLDPFNEPELIEALKAAEISAFNLEMIPRSSVAQKMDVLSSQANLAGYVSVLLGVE